MSTTEKTEHEVNETETSAEQAPKKELPPIPNKRYFTISEVAQLCQVKQHVLRYWEQEFTEQLPVTRRNNRRYYQRNEVMIIREISRLLYDEGYTISGARNKLGGGREFDSHVVRLNQTDIHKIRSDLKSVIDLIDGAIK